ncbi:unnamed protein product, partial [Meganyctiphanes norvegica]
MGVPSLTFNNGKKMPIIGLGTWNFWQGESGQVGNAVKTAIEAGYRHIDCAHVYKNEEEIGQAIRDKIKDGTVKREDLFVTSKLWQTSHSRTAVVTALKTTLKHLGLDYLDLYLIHWPFGYKEGGDMFPRDENNKIILSNVDYCDTWLGMQDAVSHGLARSIGVSNFNTKQIDRILSMCSIVPATNQVECHAFFNQKSLIDYCTSKKITVTAYAPLGSPNRLYEKITAPLLFQLEEWVWSHFKDNAKSFKMSPRTILVKHKYFWNYGQIPRSRAAGKLPNNIKVFDFELTTEEVKAMDALDCNGRVYLEGDGIGHPHHSFS